MVHSIKKSAIYFMMISIVVFSAGLAFAQQCQVIRLTLEKAGGGSKIILSPESVTVPVGTCTVWVSFVQDRDVTVSFREDAKSCEAATKGKTGFERLELATGEMCYHSAPLNLGKSTSLVWSEPGQYKYTVQYAPEPGAAGQILGPVQAQGMIVIK